MNVNEENTEGNFGIGDGGFTLDSSGDGGFTLDGIKWDTSKPGREYMRITNDGVYMNPRRGSGAYKFKQPGDMWARVDKDLNVTHLDMDMCAHPGVQDAHTALAIAVWNKAIQAAADRVLVIIDSFYADEVYDSIMRLKK